MSEPERFLTWCEAVRATYRAFELRTRSSWRECAKAWDALVAMHSPTEGDREIYNRMAVQSWMQAADRRNAA